MQELKKELSEIFQSDPRTVKLDLSNRQIRRLEDVFSEIVQFSELKSLNLSQNRMREVPTRMLGRLSKLELLNLTHNDFMETGVGKLLPGLQELPNLKHLFISVSRECEDRIISSMSQLETFNGANFYLSEYSNFEDFEEDEEKPMEERKDWAPAKSRGVESKMEDLGDDVMGSSGGDDFEKIFSLFKEVQILNGKDEEFEKVLETCKTKINVINYCFNEFASFFQEDHNIYSILSLLKENYNLYIASSVEERKRLQHLLAEEERGKKQLTRGFDVKKEELMNEIAKMSIELETKKHQLKQFEVNDFRKPLLQSTLNPRAVLMKNLSVVKKQTGKLKNSPMKKKKSGFFKHITFRKLKECVNDIYRSKQKYDLVCKKNRLPRMTLERFMMFHLNQKYGIRTVVLEWSTSILRGIKKYSKVDNNVKVFGKILKNEVDEEFRFVQEQLKDTVLELVKSNIRELCPLKREADVQMMLEKKLKGFLYEEEFIEIVKYMYNETDSQKVIRKVKDYIRINSDLVRITEYKIKYSNFLTCLLNFQLQCHEDFLSHFIKIFRQIDDDGNGVLNENQFEALVNEINPLIARPQIEKMLKKIDPHQNNKITFSDCVANLSQELVKLISRKRQRLAKEQEEDEGEEDVLDEEEGEQM